MVRPKYDQDHFLPMLFIQLWPNQAMKSSVMPYPVDHRDKKIVQAARRLFNRNGFENATVNQIMAAAGLTRGGF